MRSIETAPRERVRHGLPPSPARAHGLRGVRAVPGQRTDRGGQAGAQSARLRFQEAGHAVLHLCPESLARAWPRPRMAVRPSPPESRAGAFVARGVDREVGAPRQERAWSSAPSTRPAKRDVRRDRGRETCCGVRSAPRAPGRRAPCVARIRAEPSLRLRAPSAPPRRPRARWQLRAAGRTECSERPARRAGRSPPRARVPGSRGGDLVEVDAVGQARPRGRDPRPGQGTSRA